MDKKFICYNAAYMSYGFISNYALCTQPPMQCDHEVNEVVTLKTGIRLQIYYCAKSKDLTKTKQKGQYIGITRVEEKTDRVEEKTDPVTEEVPTSCSLSGRL